MLDGAVFPRITRSQLIDPASYCGLKQKHELDAGVLINARAKSPDLHADKQSLNVPRVLFELNDPRMLGL